MRAEANDPTTTRCGDVAIVTVRGDFDLALCLKVAPEINAVLRSPARAVVIDLEAVSLLDSSGIGLLLNAFRRLDKGGRTLAIVCPPGPARRPIELTGLDRQLPMHDTRQGALAAVGAGPHRDPS